MAGVIPGTCFTVDGFRSPQPWVKGYFLSHAHADHYTGLNENWSAGPIYCSPITASLAEHLAGVPAQHLHPLALDTPHNIQGVEVTLVDANHCPGAVQFLFELPDGSRYIHCGDMRYCRQMQDNPHLIRFRRANAVFLDTTYCHPRHTFPAQETAVEFVASCIHQLLQEDEQAAHEDAAAITAEGTRQLPATKPSARQQLPSEQQQQLTADIAEAQQQEQDPQQQADEQQQHQSVCDVEDVDSQVTAGEQLGFKRLYLISTYVIGKERLLLAVARRTGRRLLVTHRKMQVLKRIGLSAAELSSCFTTDPHESPIHVLRWGVLGDTWPYFRPNYTNMEQARQQTGAHEVVGFVPTGWLHEMNKAAAKGTFPSRTKGSCSVWLVPYSEHSSYVELKEYVAWLKPTQVVPTVNVGEAGAAGDKQRSNMMKHFRGLINEASNKAAFLAKMTRAAAAGGSGRLVAGRSASGAEMVKLEGAGADPAAAAAAWKDAAADVDDTNDAVAEVDAGFWDLCDDTRQVSEMLASELEAEAVDPAAAAGREADADIAEWHSSKREPVVGQDEIAAADPHTAAAADSSGVVSEQPGAVISDDKVTAAGDDDNVLLLLSIAGPDSSLTSVQAQQMIAVAGGDVNAAMNAFLDSQAKSKQNGYAAAAGNGSTSSSRKRQQQAPPADKSHKKVNRQTIAAVAAGQSAITSFFGRRGSVKQEQQQQGVRSPEPHESVQQDKANITILQQQQQQQQQQSVDIIAVQAGDVKPKVVLPPLNHHRSPSPPAQAVLTCKHHAPGSSKPGRSVAGSTEPAMAVAAGLHTALVDSCEQGIKEGWSSGIAAAALTFTNAHAAEAGVFQDGQTDIIDVAEPTGEAAGSVRCAGAAEAPAGPAQQQQQQQLLAKQSWAALFPSAQQSPAKRKKPAPPPPAAAIQTKADVHLSKLSPPLSTSSAPAAPAALGTASKVISSTSSSKPITQAMRDAPLLPVTRYNPVSDAWWCCGAPAPYLALALTLAAVDGTSSRLKISDALTNLFRSLMLLSPQDVTAAAYLLCGKVGPEYSTGCELNVGGGVVSAALSGVTGVSRNQLRTMYSRYGDMGDLAQACRRQQSSLVPPPPLTVSGVFKALQGLAAQSGQGAASRRQSSVALLLRCCRDVETKYLVRTLVQNLRVGAGWKSVLGPMAKAALLNRAMMEAAKAAGQQQQQHDDHSCDGLQQKPTVDIESSEIKAMDSAAVAAAAQYATSSAAKISKQQLEAAAAAAANAYHTCPNLGIIVSVLMTYGPEGLSSRVQLTCGVPVKPMLARPCTGAADAIQQLAATAAAAAVTGGPGVGRGRSRKQSNALGKTAAAAETAGAQPTAAAVTVSSSDADADGDLVDDDDDDQDHNEELDDLDQLAAAAAPGGPSTPSRSAPPSPSSLIIGSSSSLSASSLHIIAEYKYDGQRAQIHVAEDKKVSIFSRNCEDRTHSFPDVAAAILAAAAPVALPLVIDAELAAVDRSDGNRIRAFQELASRPRGSAAAAAAATAATASKMTRAASGTGKPSESAAKQQRQQTLDLGPTPGADQGQEDDPPQQQQVQSHESGIDICIFVFDALCVGGRDLMKLSLRERRAAAAAALPGATPGVVQMAEGVVITINKNTASITPANNNAAAGDGGAAAAADASAASTAAAAAALLPSSSVSVGEQLLTEYFFQALSSGTEGLMLKLLDGPGSVYQPAKRGLSWIKLKKDYLEGLADSIDLVPIGAWQGQGRKVKWYSPFLLAVYDPATETYQSLCRCISGFTDEFYAAATARLGATQISGPKPYYQTLERPDVWFEPTEVWEIRGADISISPVHRTAAGALHPDRGLGLRFPRFLRIRDDKRPEEASGPDYVVELYNKQTRRVINK